MADLILLTIATFVHFGTQLNPIDMVTITTRLTKPANEAGSSAANADSRNQLQVSGVGQTMLNRRLYGGTLLGAAGLVLVVVLTWTSVPSAVLSRIGRALVVNEMIAAPDLIVISPDAGGPGVLEAVDLVQGNALARVAVFVDGPNSEEQEYTRRGIPYESESARQVRQLTSLGVSHVLQIPRADVGTEGLGQVLPAWCREHRIKSLVFVTTRDHSRRMRRVLTRDMSGVQTIVAVRASRYSTFDPDEWWKTSTGIRTLIVELEKLVRDIVLHPV